MSPGTVDLVESSVPEPAWGEVLVKVAAVGVCGSDVRITRSGHPRVRPGSIMGHEVSGTVEAVGVGVQHLQRGDRVAIGGDVPCGTCAQCGRSRPNLCATHNAIGHQLEGGFQEFMLLDAFTVAHGPVRIMPSGVSYAEGALAEPLACCLNGYGAVGAKHEGLLLIFGAGPIGHLLGALGAYKGFETRILVDPNKSRLRSAQEFGAATHVALRDDDVLAEMVDELGHGLGAQLIFTATSSKESQSAALRLIGRGGAVNFFGGLAPGSEPLVLDSNRLHYEELTLTGSHGSTPQQHAQALDLIATGVVDVRKLVTHNFKLEEFNEAIETTASGDGLKSIVWPNGIEAKSEVEA